MSPPFLRFGSWVGADRDGNPLVTAQVTREAAVIQADHALRALENATSRIGRALTVHADAAPPGPGLTAALEAAETDHPELLASLAGRSPQEPYRTYLLYLAQRLRATRLRQADLAYRGCSDYVADLRLVHGALDRAGATRQAFGELQNLIWQARTFGFHAFGLEVRQHSDAHARALAEVEAGGAVSAPAAEVLATVRAVGWIQARFGLDACHRYVVSFTRSRRRYRRRVPAGQPRHPRRRAAGAGCGAAFRKRSRFAERSHRAGRDARARAGGGADA